MRTISIFDQRSRLCYTFNTKPDFESRMIYRKQCWLQSDILILSVDPGQNIRIFFLQLKLVSFCARIGPKGTNFQKLSKLKKKCQKTLFSQSISNILQFGGNISAPNLKWCVQWTLAHLLTPQGPLGADPYRIYQGFSICF